MKNRFKFLYILAAIFLLAACTSEPILWDKSKAFVAFAADQVTIPEQGGVVGVVVYVADTDGDALTVSFEFDTTGIANPAVEGTDFTLVNDSKSLNYPNGWGYDTIWIQPIDNDLYQGTKAFVITLTSNSADLPFGALQSSAISVTDNEHPLSLVLGTFEELDYEYDDPSLIQGPYTVDISSVEEDETIAAISNFWNESTGDILYCPVDLDAKTLTIPANSIIYVHGTYGPCTMMLIDPETEDWAYDVDIVCSIDESGNVTTPAWACVIMTGDYAGYYFTGTLYSKTVLTKQAKKSVGIDFAVNKEALTPVKLK